MQLEMGVKTMEKIVRRTAYLSIIVLFVCSDVVWLCDLTCGAKQVV